MAVKLHFDLSAPAFPWRLSRALLDHHREAASVMFGRYHASPAPGTLTRRGKARPIALAWHTPSKPAREAHANLHDAVEHGAYAVAFAAVHATDRYVVVRRAHHGSGADFLLLREGAAEHDFVKLEVSGIAEPDGPVLARRLAEKLQQVQTGDLRAPGLAVVVCFREPIVALAELS